MTSRVRQYVAGVRDAIFLKADAGRSVTVFPDDTYLVSYPKSGNTWVRFLIANLTNQRSPTTFKNVDQRLPEIYNYSDRQLRSFPRPRLLKSHEAFDFRYPKVIYIVRDPRDVAVSKYHWIRKWRGIPDGYPIEDFVRRWILAEFDRYLRAGSWADNVLSWLAMRAGREKFILVRYEDLLENAHDQLHRVAVFLGIDPSQQVLSRAIDLSSADRMRAIEKAESSQWRDTRPTRQDIPFVRKATSGGWKKACPEDAVRSIETAWWPLMKLLGYDLACPLSDGLPDPLVSERVCEALANSVKISATDRWANPRADHKMNTPYGVGA